jgi:phospholipid/cholesterol/gamma-HCH transport system ATP-binding protein
VPPAPAPAHPDQGPRPTVPPGTGVVSLRNVHKAFGLQKVLDGISVDFEAAKTTVVMGPSGCGKSVMLKHIVGLISPDTGEVHYNGRRIDNLGETDLLAVRLEVGLVFQMGALFDSMTVAENIDFPLLEHTELTRQQRLHRIAEVLDTVDLAGVEPKLPSQLSGGQRKRVAIARAMALRPKVILFDEPTTGLDPIRSDGINELIIKLKRDFGVTNIVVTHDLVSAKKVADRVIMLLGGKVAADGTYDELTRSTDVRVQHFLTGHYERDDDTFMPEVARTGIQRVGIRLDSRVTTQPTAPPDASTTQPATSPTPDTPPPADSREPHP